VFRHHATLMEHYTKI